MEKEDREYRNKVGKSSSIIGIFCNIFLCVSKGLVGLIFGSISIIADALNNLADASSNIIALLGFKLASKPADKDHPYGHGRYEYVASFVVSFLVLIVGFELGKESVGKIINQESITFSLAMIIVLVLSISVKCFMMIYYKAMGKKINSETLLAISVDSRNDMITTSLVLVSIIVYKFTSFNCDAIVGLLISIFILISGIKLIKETLDPLLGKAPSKEFVDYIANKIKSYEGVYGVHDLIVHDYGPGRIFISAHAEMSDKEDPLVSHEIIDKIEKDFYKNDNLTITIHYDPIAIGDRIVDRLNRELDEIVKEINVNLSIHDLRIVKGDKNSNLIFDCSKEADITIEDEEIIRLIKERVGEKYKKYSCVITIKQSYV